MPLGRGGGEGEDGSGEGAGSWEVLVGEHRMVRGSPGHALGIWTSLNKE